MRRKERVVETLLNRHGRLYSEAVGLDLRPGSPSVLFQWLCAALLLGGRIRAKAAEQAAAALLRQGWTTAEKMVASTWEERTRLLNRAGYARYDESTSTRLGGMAQMLLDRYGGDLRNLREAAHRDPQEERRLLKEFKGIGDVRVDIFFREIQLVWDELYPFADGRALHAASDLGLGSDAETLARLVDPPEFARLLAALVRCDLAKDAPEILAEAAA
jgi:endonuclease III